jgi:starch phosphorylase
MHPAVGELLDRHVAGWREPSASRDALDLSAVPDEAIWELRNTLRGVLVAHARLEAGREWLSPDVLTIGFARRFAPYKRGNLLFTDPDRLERLLHHAQTPVQVLFAGKAHPRDAAGQGIIREVIRWTRDPRFRGKVLFLQDYDMGLARRLVQGVDVWLNNPRRPREASGTSGMKVPLNFGINLSVLDGWWPEAWDGTNGWTIGEARDYATPEEQDADDALDLYRVLEEEVLPSFYARDAGGIPRRWVQMARRSLETCFRAFHTHRMVSEYATSYYVAR